MKIVFCASEVVPFAKTGGLADVAGALPIALENQGQEVIVVMPGYKAVQNVKNIKSIRLNDKISYSIIGKNVKVYFIENDKYFNRDGLYGDKNGDHPDNLERFSYYCKEALNLLKEINFKPDMIHCHDWQSGLIPVYLKTTYSQDQFYKNIRTMFTIHNIGYQGLFSRQEFPKLGLDWSLFTMDTLEFYDKINILKGGLVFSDLITTVSATYSKEIQTKEFGFGLESILLKRRESVSGILNGLDYSVWDPATDKFIAKNYSLKTVSDKGKCKEDLQKACKLPLEKDIPLFGIVSRLAEQKGFDLLAADIDKICKLKAQLVILGTGDLKYHQLLEGMVKKYPKVISLNLKFDDCLAHKIYAGTDIFLMPSKYEPCGLGQLISLKYGTIPLVFKTGGLADTVNKDNGFIFDKYDPAELLKTIKKSIEVYKDGKKWPDLRFKAMKCDFSWAESAKKYIELYGKKAK
ncbi:MAG: glycogen synthase GlgA [Candidatus Omnitrophota bacterium]|nr:glycogen synthase GlgA [Candidatus Omnitrophota bacterium]MBU1928880.1 glycogen synthase GlgA [Candidatus Omnitrophota bacterium]MBU2034490.1 glycogen synthase GlgA [Candidatus Omnitrophota bacterium]MBU2221817.1 glycogen synthase GlgA [Candidatus Omnitrophota bacterium]MBU2258323.1 glycogen synthase GlgA [Candidatus Omnitrophota bacterium]